MGIYIKGMEMPKDCDSCTIGNIIKCVLWKPMNIGEIHPCCPLIEVPKPHGRLIDADACIDYIRNNNQHAWEALAYEPTIIESEVEE